MKKITIFGKTISATALALVLTAVLGSATLLTYYGTITATVNVQQSIILEGTCSKTIGVIGSEIAYNDECNIKSNTVNDLNVKFENSCSPDCTGIIITNQVKLSIKRFEGTDSDAFVKDFYKGTYYDWTGSLTNLNTIDYAFKITYNNFGSDTLAPYVVIIGPEFPADVAVYMIPDGTTYSTGIEYAGTINSDSKFHVPGDAVCTQSTPCTLAQLKIRWSTATVTSIKYAIGAWPGLHTQYFEAFIGLSKINGVQAVYKSLKVYGTLTIPTVEKYEFAPAIVPGQYTITTNIVPAP